jgi:hypothetical protein
MSAQVLEQIVGLPTLPASGKVDRKALVKPEITVDTGRQLEAPATPAGARLPAP